MSFCVRVPKILLPRYGIDYKAWAVVACDQFTSEKEYWEKLKAFVGDKPSALNLILPEAYLSQDNSEYINKINQSMKKYLEDGIFETLEDCFIYIERSTPHTKRRRGLIAAIDLQAYSYRDEDKALIRATEGTVLSRIPPRVQIRQNAPVELPHIMVLLDDREDSVIGGAEAKKAGCEVLYDFDLNMDGGHITGYKVSDTENVLSALKALLDPEILSGKYNNAEKLLLAVGDGNHSLASAKACWENIKPKLSESERENHPARFALVEIVNIHDSGLVFEPIHRVVFGADNEKLALRLKEHLSAYKNKSGTLIYNGRREEIALPDNAAEAVGAVQKFLDTVTAEKGGETDYIHGEASVESICKKENALGILLPPLKKEDLFSYLVKFGSLPRKTFSMGEAVEKRYYIEARKIIL